MSSTLFEPKHCVTCNKIGGVLTCDGCKQAFCGKHVVEHRQQLTIEVENIMQEHDCIQQDIVLQRDNHPSLQQIDTWEKESITRIQMAAEKARNDLRQLLQSSGERFTKICREIAVTLRSAREDENFSEIDLARWTQQLNELKLEIKSQTMIDIPKNSSSGIHFIRIEQDNTTNALTNNKDLLPLETLSSAMLRERFTDVIGLAIVEDEGLCIKHNDNDFKYIYPRGHQLYSQGRHTVKFKTDKCANSCNLFVGICSSNIDLRIIIYRLTIVAGWFSNNELWQHGIRGNNNTEPDQCKTDDIKTNDVFELTLDCDTKQIELFRERTNTRDTTHVDLDKTPFPWCILVALRRKDDCVRILSSS